MKMFEFELERQRSAFFEAGHVVGAWLEGWTVERVLHCPEENAIWCDVAEPVLPVRGPLRRNLDRTEARALIRALLSGPAAQEIYSFGLCSEELMLSAPDLAGEMCIWRAAGLARRLGHGTTVLPRHWHEVRENLKRPGVWSAITVVAGLLLEWGELSGDGLREIAVQTISAISRG